MGDSGACATALLCGVKGRFETVGLDDGGVYNRCDTSFGSRVYCLADWAQNEGNSALYNFCNELIKNFTQLNQESCVVCNQIRFMLCMTEQYEQRTNIFFKIKSHICQ